MTKLQILVVAGMSLYLTTEAHSLSVPLDLFVATSFESSNFAKPGSIYPFDLRSCSMYFSDLRF